MYVLDGYFEGLLMKGHFESLKLLSDPVTDPDRLKKSISVA